MSELRVEVRTGGDPPAEYVFDQLPLRVGRAPESGLAICHEAVPRELLTAWLEDNGRAVRIEPGPELRNPLLHRGKPVRGGISGAILEVSVGPVALVFRSGPAASQPNLRASRRIGPMVAGTALAIGAVVLLIGIGDRPGASRSNPAGIPSDLSLPAATGDLPGRDPAIWIAEAEDRLARRVDPIQNRIRAVRLMKAAVLATGRDSESAVSISRRAEALETRLRAEFRLVRRTYLEAHRSGTPSLRSQTAAALLPWLEALDAPAAPSVRAAIREASGHPGRRRP